jgi:CheY-like chemotaxis protein
MKNSILCSSNPLLIKGLYGILRDEGYSVDTIEHPARAVQMVMQSRYDLIVIDSEPFGLSAEDAVQIIKAVAPNIPVMFVGRCEDNDLAQAVVPPLDLEQFKQAVRSITVRKREFIPIGREML